MGNLLKVIVTDFTILGSSNESSIFCSVTQQFFVESKFSVNEISLPPAVDIFPLATTMYTFVRKECGTDIGSGGIIYGVTISEDHSGVSRIREHCQYVSVVRRCAIYDVHVYGGLRVRLRI